MRQLSLDPSSAVISLLDVPVPGILRCGVLVRTAYSLISTGTKLSTVNIASKSLLGKARERPDQVVKLLEAARTDGILATIKKVRDRLWIPHPPGYSLA